MAKVFVVQGIEYSDWDDYSRVIGVYDTQIQVQRAIFDRKAYQVKFTELRQKWIHSGKCVNFKDYVLSIRETLPKYDDHNIYTSFDVNEIGLNEAI